MNTSCRPGGFIRLLCGALALLALAAQAVAADATPAVSGPWIVALDPANAFNFIFVKGNTHYGDLNIQGFGAHWSWSPPETRQGFAENGVLDISTRFFSAHNPDKIIHVREVVSKTAPKTLTFKYTLSAAEDQQLTQLSPYFSLANANYQQGSIVWTGVDNTTFTWNLPIPRRDSQTKVKAMAFKLTNVGEIDVTFDPPFQIPSESNALRMPLAAATFPKGATDITISYTFPDEVDFCAGKDEVAQHEKLLADASWFDFTPANTVKDHSVIGMEDWLGDGAAIDARGGVRQVGSHFEFAATHALVKFWGVNLQYADNAPPHVDADYTAARFAKYGVNCVRLHKFLNAGWEGIGSKTDSTQFDPKGLEQFDYFTNALKAHGIYYGFSHSYGFKVRPGDKAKLWNYEEIMQQDVNGSTYGLINFCPDIQDLMITALVEVLKHKNPYTGLSYAQDPALAFVECQNEDNIFFWASPPALAKCPSYKAKLNERFAAWLKAKYGSDAAVKTAWGGNLGDGQSVNTSVACWADNIWQFTTDGLLGVGGGHRRFMMDSAAFLHHEQDQFYAKFVKAVRDAGYQGPLEGSPWWAPDMLPQYYTLLSDATVGHVDRHNYFAGGEAQMFTSMLSDPGSGYLSSGMEQVKDHTFGVSEWNHVYPNVYQAEGPVIMAAYGLGLQGWNSALEFRSSSTQDWDNDSHGMDKLGFQSDAGDFHWRTFTVDRIDQLGQYPVLARMVARGDISEGTPILIRRVSDANLDTGVFDFHAAAEASGDVKQYGDHNALAAGKVLVEFTGSKTVPSTLPDMSPFTQGKVISANNKQLTWDYAGKGDITINTAGTKGVCGFTPATPHILDNVTITLNAPYASLLLTSLDKDKSLADCHHALLSAVARISNKGFKYYDFNNEIIDNGTDNGQKSHSIVVEPVLAKLSLAGRPIAAINILDIDGCLQPGKSLPVTPTGDFTIDTGKDKTVYYEVVFN